MIQHQCIRLTACLPVMRPVCLSARCSSYCLSVCLSAWLSVLSVCLPDCMSACPCIQSVQWVLMGVPPYLWTCSCFDVMHLFSFVGVVRVLRCADLPGAGMIAVALTPNLKIAAVCTSYMVSLFHLFAGFVMTQPDMPGWWYAPLARVTLD